MAELGDQVREKVGHKILQFVAENEKDLCFRLLEKVQRCSLHFSFIVLGR